ncbi:hypothetical protein LOC68_08925 [Blastopirellula sp. JC732]|uniref:Carboxypeptidase regulatory-like domain-containing protein n=1 Tax=Blastopirellula sediminis TaxID=2894196 RepID=A0A9X1MLH3_9BACT|nr:hypothetical protein [Blastopirellula sediminis]MCC9608706.1 hypothetical protein [Blastopirellula sediminis]MCC9628517.1 hypothetical protein [Blastopirellula sediminis]
MITVVGTVTLDGDPLQSGSVIFSPKAGAVNDATSGQIIDGKYELDCVPGEKNVMVTGTTASKKMAPFRYLSPSAELTASVESGSEQMELNLALSSKSTRRGRSR